MHFSHLDDGKGSKVTKIAAVALFHVIVATLLIKSMAIRSVSLPHVPEEVVLLLTPDVPPPPPPPDPPQPMPHMAPPQIVVPPPAIVPAQAPPPDAVTATVSADPPAQQQPATPAQPPAATVPAASRGGGIHTAVLADASACVKPDYPVRAARDGVSGTVTLALLVGIDGRVAGSRVEHSSGSRDLDKATIAALSMCKFKPATNGGVPEQAWAQIAYVWTLEQ
jgi:protein TonB